MNTHAEKVHKALDTAISQIDRAVNNLVDAQQLIHTRLQAVRDTDEARLLESIDDKLHDALAALGQ